MFQGTHFISLSLSSILGSCLLMVWSHPSFMVIHTQQDGYIHTLYTAPIQTVSKLVVWLSLGFSQIMCGRVSHSFPQFLFRVTSPSIYPTRGIHKACPVWDQGMSTHWWTTVPHLWGLQLLQDQLVFSMMPQGTQYLCMAN